MNLRERSLYHQIHPVKLLTDWVSTVPALYLFWQHNLLLGVIIALVPSLVASVTIIRLVDLTGIRESKSERYLRDYMTDSMQSVRLLGFIEMMAGAWTQLLSPIILGTGMILFAWLRGLVLSRIHSFESVFLAVSSATLTVDTLLALGGQFHFTILDVAMDLAAGAALGILTVAIVSRLGSGRLRVGTVITMGLVGIVLVLSAQGGQPRQLVLGLI